MVEKNGLLCLGHGVVRMHICFRQWHTRLFAIMAANVLEGDNPWNFVARSLHDSKVADSWAIVPGVARASRFCPKQPMVC